MGLQNQNSTFGLHLRISADGDNASITQALAPKKSDIGLLTTLPQISPSLSSSLLCDQAQVFDY